MPGWGCRYGHVSHFRMNFPSYRPGSHYPPGSQPCRPGTSIHPNRFLNRWSNGDLIITTQGIDENDLEVSFRWNETGQKLFIGWVRRRNRNLGQLRSSRGCIDIGKKLIDSEFQIVRIPNFIPVGIGRFEVEPNLGGKAEVAIVVGQSGHRW